MAQPLSSRLLFASYHSYTDPSSGAAIATRDLLELLAARRWDTRVLCGPAVDFERGESLLQLLSDQQIPYRVGRGTAGSTQLITVHYRQNDVPVAAYLASPPAGGAPTHREGNVFLALLDQALDAFKPDVLLTYGGSWISPHVWARARRRGVKVVFALHNFAYRDKAFFSGIDAALVPSHFAANWYRQRVGIRCTAIPSPLNLSRVQCEPSAGPRYVAFVNPQPAKGVFVFTRIAQELSRRRPDIPFLVVEGRGGVNWLGRTGVDLRGLTNISMMTNTPDPRDFYRVSRLVLMPSLCNESFGRVAAESMANGIPVLASDRGALPEVVSDAGRLFEIAAHYTPATRAAPTADEVDPWVQAIVQLWDNEEIYQQMSGRCRRAAQRWHPEQLGPQYEAFTKHFFDGWIVGAIRGRYEPLNRQPRQILPRKKGTQGHSRP